MSTTTEIKPETAKISKQSLADLLRFLAEAADYDLDQESVGVEPSKVGESK